MLFFWLTVYFGEMATTSGKFSLRLETSNASSKVCYEPQMVKVPVNVSHLYPITEVSWSFCWSWTFSCKTETTTWTTRWETKNITRVVKMPVCCPGYASQNTSKEDAHVITASKESLEDSCKPVCQQDGGCKHGECISPGVCRCESGWSGGSCQVEGCPPGSWGPDCTNVCNCALDFECDSVSGECICPPGLTGPPACNVSCAAGRYGEDCAGLCNCMTGSYCHPVTGECVTCSQGLFGSNCSSKCSCSTNGTALCDSTHGECYCKANWFGAQCNMHCPFGYKNGTCLEKGGGGCVCPNYLYLCDPDSGCICPDGVDCGIEQSDQVDLQYLSAGSSNKPVVIAVSVVLSLGILCLCLLGAYYRRRIRRFQTQQINYNNSKDNGGGSDTNSSVLRPEPLPPVPHLNIQESSFTNMNSGRSATSNSSAGMDNPIYEFTDPDGKLAENSSRVKESKVPNYGATASVDTDDGLYSEPRPLRSLEKAPWSLLDEFQDKYGKSVDNDGFSFDDEFGDDGYDHLSHLQRPNVDHAANYTLTSIK